MDTTKPAQWFRMYSEFATDPKVQMLSESYQRRYIMLLCIRCGNGDVTLQKRFSNGCETNIDEEIAFQLRISVDEWIETKAVFVSKNLINSDCNPIAWEKRQYSSDSSTERVKRYRENKGTDMKRFRNVSVTPPETETETETEINKDNKPLSVSQAKADPIPYDSIIESVNQILCKKFRATDKHKTLIRARWGEGFRECDFSAVCSIMLTVWGEDPKMQAYLRPETLFGTKMDGYLNTAPVSCNKQLSKSEQWRKETQSEVNAFVYGGDNDQDNGQRTGQAAIC